MKKIIIILILLVLNFQVGHLIYINAEETTLVNLEGLKQSIDDYNEEQFFLIEYKSQNKYIDHLNEEVTDNLNYKETKKLISDYRKQLKKSNVQFINKLFTDFPSDIEVERVDGYLPYILVSCSYNQLYSYAVSEDRIVSISHIEPFNMNDDIIEPTVGYSSGVNFMVDQVSPTYDIHNTTKINAAKYVYNVTGDNIKIGILEEDPPFVDDNPQFSYSQYRSINLEDSSEAYGNNSFHATNVGIIAAGKDGVAERADVYFHTTRIDINDSETQFIDLLYDLNDMIEAGVDVINISLRFEHDGLYNGYSKYVDAIISETKVSIVVAAGNEGNRSYMTAYKNERLGGLAISLNAITVGSTTTDGEYISTFSSLDDNYSKPNVYAPGGDLLGTNIDHSNKEFDKTKFGVYIPDEETRSGNIADRLQGIGTSYAAPQVTGLIALMMELRPSLMVRPEVVSAIVSAGSDTNNLKLRTQCSVDVNHAAYNHLCNEELELLTESVDEINDIYGMNLEGGAGLINAIKILEMTDSSSYFFYSSSSSTPGTAFTKTIEFDQVDHIKIAHTFLYHTNTTTELLYGVDDFDLVITGPNNLRYETTSTFSNIELLDFEILVPGEYSITIYLREKHYNANPVARGAIAIQSINGYTIPLPPSFC